MLPCQGRGREFESRLPLIAKLSLDRIVNHCGGRQPDLGGFLEVVADSGFSYDILRFSGICFYLAA
jgi:hypothetical protein